MAIGLNIVASVLDAILFGVGASTGPLGFVVSLAILIPGIAVSVRRLHDTGRSGWWILIGLIPIVGLIVLIYFYVQDSEPGENMYGPNPKADDVAWEASGA